MKKIILAIALTAGIVSATFALPNDKNKAKAAEKDISFTLRSQITYPEFLKAKDGDFSATLVFQVTDCGGIVVKEIECGDRELRTNLLGQAANVRVNTDGLDRKGTYKVVVRFLTL